MSAPNITLHRLGERPPHCIFNREVCIHSDSFRALEFPQESVGGKWMSYLVNSS